MELRGASAEDCRTIAEVHVASWKAAYSELLPREYLSRLSVDGREAFWRQSLAAGNSEVIVALAEAKVVGFVSFGRSRDADAPAQAGEIWALYVHPEFWSRGVGHELMQASRRRLGDLGLPLVSLWVLAANERAIRFYLAAGFLAEAGSEREVNIGGAKLQEQRMVAAHAV
jgi:ribosomal protein S18 acetylase RimI-like enzyme